MRSSVWAVLAIGTMFLVLWSAIHPAALVALLTAGTLPALFAFVALACLSGRIAALIRNTLAAQRAAADLGRFMRQNTGFRAARAAIQRPSPHA